MPQVISLNSRSAVDNPSISPLDDLVAEAVSRLEAGESLDAAALTANCPELRPQLEKLLPTLAAMVDLGHAAAAAAVPHKKTSAPPDSPQPATAHARLGFSPPARGEGSGEGGAGILGDFRIIREIGRGGMGVVYEAEQISLGRRVALKVLPFASMLDQQQLARFKNEARAAATLKHPNIVSVYSVGSERSVHYYAMELIEGQSLAEVIAAMRSESGREEERKSSSVRDQEQKVSSNSTTALPLHGSPVLPSTALPLYRSAAPLPETPAHAHLSTLRTTNHHEYFQTAAGLGLQAAEALQHAHDHGILHRDIKPGNLLIQCSHLAPRDESVRLAERDGCTLYIADFGLARIEADAGLTMTGDLIGTLRYMAPEQALAKRVVIDHRADVYSLGATLYELLTLQPAFGESDRSALLKQIAFEDPRPLRKHNRQIPAELETIILKAMEKNPDERYQAAAALASDLRAFLDERPIKAKPPSYLGLAKKWRRRHRPLVTSAATAAAAIVLISLGLLASSNVAITREQGKTKAALDDRTAALEEKATALLDRTAALDRAEWNYKKALEAVDQLLARVGDEKLADVPQLDQLRMDVLTDAMMFYESFLDENPDDPKVKFELAKTYCHLGGMHLDFWQTYTSLKYYRKAASLFDHLYRESPSHRVYRYELAAALLGAGWIDKSTNFLRVLDLIAQPDEPIPEEASYRETLVDVLTTYGAAILIDDPRLGTGHSIERLPSLLKRAFHVANLPGIAKRRLGHVYAMEAKLALREERYDDAILSYQNAISSCQDIAAAHPTDGRTRMWEIDYSGQLATLLEQRGDYKGAEHYYRAAIRVGVRLTHDFPSTRKYHTIHNSTVHWFVQFLQRESRSDEALELLSQMDPITPQELVARAQLYQSLEKPDLAQADYQLAVDVSRKLMQTDSSNVDFLVAMFEGLSATDRRDEALALARNMVTTDVESERNLIRLYLRFSSREMTELDWQTQFKLLSGLKQLFDPEPYSWNHRGNAYLIKGDYERAAEDFSVAIQRDPNEVVFYISRADAYTKLNRHDKAIEDYEAAIKLDPNDLGPMNSLAWILATLPDDKYRDGKRAVDLATKACELTNFKDAALLDTLAAAYAEAGDFEQAIERQQQAIKFVGKEKPGAADFTRRLESYQAGRPWRVGEH